MVRCQPIKALIGVMMTGLFALCISIAGAAAAEPAQFKTSGGLSVYLGVIPAEIVKGPEPHSGERPMHGRIPRGPHEYHIVAAIFDAGNGARVADATITAQVAGIGMAGRSKKLEPMQIAGTTTYGTFFNLPGRDLYTVTLSVERPGLARPVTFAFKYDHR